MGLILRPVLPASIARDNPNDEAAQLSSGNSVLGMYKSWKSARVAPLTALAQAAAEEDEAAAAAAQAAAQARAAQLDVEVAQVEAAAAAVVTAAAPWLSLDGVVPPLRTALGADAAPAAVLFGSVVELRVQAQAHACLAPLCSRLSALEAALAAAAPLTSWAAAHHARTHTVRLFARKLRSPSCRCRTRRSHPPLRARLTLPPSAGALCRRREACGLTTAPSTPPMACRLRRLRMRRSGQSGQGRRRRRGQMPTVRCAKASTA